MFFFFYFYICLNTPGKAQGHPLLLLDRNLGRTSRRIPERKLGMRKRSVYVGNIWDPLARCRGYRHATVWDTHLSSDWLAVIAALYDKRRCSLGHCFASSTRDMSIISIDLLLNGHLLMFLRNPLAGKFLPDALPR